MNSNIGLLLVGFVLNTYAQSISQIYFQDKSVFPNCGFSTKFADFVFQAPITATYTFDTRNLETSCVDTILLLPSNKAVCNDDISQKIIRSKLTLRLAAGSKTFFYVGSYKDSCSYGSTVSFRVTRYVPETDRPTNSPTSTKTVSPSPITSKGPTGSPVMTKSPTLVTSAPVITKSPTVATSAPVMTNSPTLATIAPVMTKSPTLVTSAPVMTKSPTVATSAPVMTNSPTLATSAPVITNSPTLATSAPVMTKSPTLATSAPVMTKSPTLATSAPVMTKSPTVATSAPVITKSPTVATSAPVITKSPTVATSAPVMTKSPTLATSAPVMTKSPTTKSPTIAVAPYKIEIVFSNNTQDKYKAAFTNAVNRWQQIITRDLPLAMTVENSFLTKSCFEFDPHYPSEYTIDDLIIGVDVLYIDGEHYTLADAGICLVDPAGFPRAGKMRFDSADADRLLKEGGWEAVILHEMGHMLGIGTMWIAHGLISAPNAESYCTYCYLGANGNIGNELIGRPAGQKAIIEDTGGPGTIRAHWKESVYGEELMSSYRGAMMPISALTVYSLKDIGYTVDVSKADPFTVSGKRRLRETKDSTFNYEDHIIWTNSKKIARGTPKPNRELEADNLIRKNGGQARIPVEVWLDDSN